jgi:hypothetical protein
MALLKYYENVLLVLFCLFLNKVIKNVFVFEISFILGKKKWPNNLKKGVMRTRD